MPPLGSEVRAQQLTTVGRLAHEQFVDDEIGGLLEELAPWAEELQYESDEASIVRMTRRDFEKATRVPPSLTAETSRTGSYDTLLDDFEPGMETAQGKLAVA